MDDTAVTVGVDAIQEVKVETGATGRENPPND